jgi:asparagine synthetase B (glutamine-hydrolysing)
MNTETSPITSEPVPSDRRRISIRGLPVYSGALLSFDSPVFASLHSRADFMAFARGLRGQFSIVIEDESTTVAITDFGCSRPVFYIPDVAGKGFHISSRLQDLVPFSSNHILREALFFYVSRSGVGIEPFYSDVMQVHPARVTWFQGGDIDSVAYLDWEDYLQTSDIGPKAAEERFLEIAGGYLSAIAKARGPIACLLSGGIDSALIAWLLRSIGQESLNLTADYSWNRYSEFASASANAKALGVPNERVRVTSSSRRRAFGALNSGGQNSPCCNAQSPILFDLAQRAQLDGIATLATGDHADALFLGFDRFFSAFPRDSGAYLKTTTALDAAGKLDHVFPKPGRTPSQGFLLSLFGASPAGCLAWEESINAGDRSVMEAWARRTPLHTLQQLGGQIWAGISWQNSFLPVSQAFEDKVEFVSPFFDLEMIRFALSLPLEYKFQNGVTKVLLRRIASRLLGREVPKRASPNPARIWRLAPDLAERRSIPTALRTEYDRLVWNNLRQSGRLWSEVDKLAAFGLWLGEQPLQSAISIEMIQATPVA